MSLDTISMALRTGQADEAVIRQIMALHREDVPRTLERSMLVALSDAADAKLRNALAIALAEVGSKDAAKRIFDLLIDPKTIGARATLLYALGELDVLPSIFMLVHLVTFDAPEASEEALLLLERSAQGASTQERDVALFLLRHFLQAASKRRQSAINRAIEILTTH